MMSDVGSQQWWTLKVGETWWEWESTRHKLSVSTHPQISQWRAEPLNYNYKTEFAYPKKTDPQYGSEVFEDEKHAVPDLGGAYMNVFGGNFDLSNPTPVGAPGDPSYSAPKKSGGFFGVPAQDAPTVCMRPTVEWPYSYERLGRSNMLETNTAKNHTFVLWNPRRLIATTTTTTTQVPMQAADYLDRCLVGCLAGLEDLPQERAEAKPECLSQCLYKPAIEACFFEFKKTLGYESLDAQEYCVWWGLHHRDRRYNYHPDHLPVGIEFLEEDFLSVGANWFPYAPGGTGAPYPWGPHTTTTTTTTLAVSDML